MTRTTKSSLLFVVVAAVALTCGASQAMAAAAQTPVDGLSLAANVTYIDAHLTDDLPGGGRIERWSGNYRQTS